MSSGMNGTKSRGVFSSVEEMKAANLRVGVRVDVYGGDTYDIYATNQGASIPLDNGLWAEVVVSNGITPSELITAQNDIVGGSIFKGSNGEYVQNGDTIPVGTTHLRISIGGNEFLVRAWGDVTYPASVISMPTSDNGLNGYDIVTSQGTFEFVTEEDYFLRSSWNIDGWGADDNKDSTMAMVALREYIKSKGSGSIVGTPGKTYLVTNHKEPGDNSFYGQSFVFDFSGSSVENLAIGMGGCKIKVADGSHYGSFDPASGSAVNDGPNTSYRNSPGTIFSFNGVKGVSGFMPEIDGNNENLTIGGTYGDTGIQIQNTGLRLIGETRDVTLFCKSIHHMGLDGCALNVTTSIFDEDHGISIFGLRSEFNGRQGLSFSGGAGVVFYSLCVNNTGMGGVFSAPGAGIDIEPESGNYVSNLKIFSGEAINNTGVGLLVWDPGQRCRGFYMRDFTLWGTSNHAAWIRDGVPDVKYVLDHCDIHGQVVYAQNVDFIDCNIDDAIHPVYGEYVTTSFLISNIDNADFDDKTEISASKHKIGLGGIYKGTKIKCEWDSSLDSDGGVALRLSDGTRGVDVENQITGVADPSTQGFFVESNVDISNPNYDVGLISGNQDGSLSWFSRDSEVGQYPNNSGPKQRVVTYSTSGIGTSRVVGVRGAPPSQTIGDNWVGVVLQQGDIINNYHPQPGEFLGWVLTTSGWKGFGAIES